jgi:hypothetical protein
MIKIDKINWLSEEAKEAEVCLSDGKFNIICFSHPFDQAIGETVSLPLHALNADEIYKLDEGMASVKKEMTAFGYKLSGYVINKNSGQVKIGEFIIQLDVPLPNDVETNQYVTFVCDRIDLY